MVTSWLLGGARFADHPPEAGTGWLAVAGERIVARGAGPAPGTPDIDVGGALVVPGFVDLHCHGGGDGAYHDGSGTRAAAHHRRHGTTATLASLMSAAPGELLARVADLVELTRQGVVEGIHLEGPWLSVACCGAHDPDLLRDPGPAEVAALVAAAGPALKMVTLAPERPGALDAVRQLVAAGVVVAIGHTAASFEVTRAAIDAGARVATHLGNAMAPLHQRRPGPILALLEDRRVVCEVIADGHHLHPAFAGHLVARAGAPRTALITDAVVPGGRGRGATEGRDGAVWLCGRDVLAGSALTMDAAFEAATTALGLTVPDAVRVTSTTAAAVLGRGDLGHLGPGARADLVVLGPRGASSVLARGHWVDTTPG